MTLELDRRLAVEEACQIVVSEDERHLQIRVGQENGLRLLRVLVKLNDYERDAEEEGGIQGEITSRVAESIKESSSTEGISFGINYRELEMLGAIAMKADNANDGIDLANEVICLEMAYERTVGKSNKNMTLCMYQMIYGVDC